MGLEIENSKDVLEVGVSGTPDSVPGVKPPIGVRLDGGGGTFSVGVVIGFVLPPDVPEPGGSKPPAVLQICITCYLEGKK